MNNNNQILCIDRMSLIRTNVVQKDIKLHELLTEHCKYFSSEKEAVEKYYIPLDICISVRSAYTNKVLEKPALDSSQKRYYINYSNIPPLPHRGMDLVMYISSLGIISSIKNYDAKFNDIMMKSQFCPIGILNLDEDIFNPIVYSQVVLEDSTIEAFNECLKEGYNLIDIKDMNTLGNLKSLCDEIIIVKEESIDE